MGGVLRLHKNPWDFKNDWFVEYPPLLNHCVLFETNEVSWHGFDKVNVPPTLDISRRSFTIYMYTKDRPANEVAQNHGTIYVQSGPPKCIREGHTLTKEDVAEVEDIFLRRNNYLQAMYKDKSDVLSQQERHLQYMKTLQQALRVPSLGYVKQIQLVGDFYPNNGVGSGVELTCFAIKPVKSILLRGSIPEFLGENNIYLCVDSYPRQTLKADGGFEISIGVDISANHRFTVSFGGSNIARPPNGDLRAFSMHVSELEFVHV